MSTLITKVITKRDIVIQLQALSLSRGMSVEVHCAMSKIGFVAGGAQTIVDALAEVVGHEGNIVMSYQCSDNSEPGYWENPPAKRELWDSIRDNIPAYSVEATDALHMGAVAENLSRRQGTYCSAHPNCAFIASGKHAKLITARHDLDFPLADNSPLGQLYKMPAAILLIGVDYDNCTGMHLGECRSNTRDIIVTGAAVNDNGYRKWERFMDYDVNSDEFVEIGREMEKLDMVHMGYVGDALCRCVNFQQAVDYTEQYLRKKYNTEETC